ncbi:MAG: CHAT domain-containing protein, partial [Dokdonella sp.]|uniref:CHAT domain-containing protein n=1 Tax=Dokdonella sp. TaxID=2291710 RepID=UPI0032652AE0
MASIIVTGGQPDPSVLVASALFDQRDALVRVDPSSARSLRIVPASRAGPLAKAALADCNDNDLVELELDGGIRVWMSVDALRASRRFNMDVRDGQIEVGPSMRGLPGDRGFGVWVIKAMTVVAAPHAGKLAHAKLVAAIDARLGSAPGLYRIAGDPRTGLVAFKAPAKAPASPYLLFLHGTASSTHGSFGGLWQVNGGASIAELKQRYAADQILTLQHRTLTESPIDNALAIATALPAGAVLHLVSHSRGGLIGELLARAGVDAGKAPFGDDDLALFDAAVAGNVAWKDQPATLRRLADLLATKRFRVERFARVACPALGTTLASGKLQDWCNIAMNVLGGVGALTGAPTLAAISDLLKGLIAGLITFDDVPGLQAMDPSGPLVKLLNAEGASTQADLAIVGGTTQGHGVWNRLKMLLVDAFFAGDNDLVVDTPAMSGGTQRENGAIRFLQRSADIHHFAYFDHPVTARHVLDALSDIDRLARGFDGVDVSHVLRGAVSRRRRPLPDKPPVVFVLPGIMGSCLDVGPNRVWVDYGQLVFTGLSKLGIDQPDVTPTMLDADTYSGLLDFLGDTHDVIAFPYDWRLSVDAAGARLNDALKAKLAAIDTTRQPIRFVAHSMGGLVVRAMMARADSAWPAICAHTDARVLMLGTPNRGSHAITQLILGRERTLRLLDTLNVKQGMRGLLGVVDRYRGALDLLPWPSDRDYFNADVWAALMPLADGTAVDAARTTAWPTPSKADLAASHAFCAALAEQPLDPHRVVYVAGQADETAIGIAVEGKGLTFMATAAGDGRVPWDTGIPDGISAWYVDAVHGDIPAHRRSWPGYLDLLQSGTTQALRHDRPATRGTDDVFELREIPVSYLPDADAIARAGIGRAQPQSIAAAQTFVPIPVRVSWGDLGYASHIVMVGHYANDSVVSAEAALDAHLGGELRRRHQLGLYPAAIGTALVLEDALKKPPGVIVIGLGDVGELGAGTLSNAVAYGVLAWFAERIRDAERSGQSLPDDGLSLLLVGSGAGGLDMPNAIDALLRGVALALERIAPVSPDPPGISDIEFIELYEDRAHSLWHDLGDVIDASELKGRFQRSGTLGRLPDARRRVRTDVIPAWWQRLQITRDGDTLVFNDTVARARTEVRVLPTQRRLVDDLLAEATRSSARDPALETTLFELLGPNELKETAPRRANRILVLDRDTARYPWELMTNQRDANGLPQAVVAGVLRQFSTVVFRRSAEMATLHNALVIGDPLGPFPPLPGAQQEARAVGERLSSSGYDVTQLNDRPRTSSILRALYAAPYRVVHLAGHGVADISAVETPDAGAIHANAAMGDPASSPISGMVLEDGVYLTHAEIEQMRSVPELVFVNCCHLGAITDNPNEVAAQFALKFIEIGVRAVVAAGWAVDDAAATHFAGEFYAQMLGGSGFGDAVKRARRVCFAAFPDANTFGAYQCYGDPDYRLTALRSIDDRSSGAVEYASDNELIIDGIERAFDGYIVDQTEADVAARLDTLAATAENLGFLASGRVHEALAGAYARIGRFDDAVMHDRAAIAADGGSPAATLGALQRFTAMRVRQAVSTLGPAVWRITSQKAPSARARAAAAASIRSAIADFEPQLVFGRTRDRLATLGSAEKRLALVATSVRQQRAALDRMQMFYEEASARADDRDDPHSLLQLALAMLLLARTGAPRSPAAKAGARKAASAKDATLTKATQARHRAIDRLLDRAADLQRQFSSSTAPYVWTDTAEADVDLIRAIHTDSLDGTTAKHIVAGYTQALTRANDYAARTSIIENVGLIHALLGETAGGNAATLANLK